MDFSGDEMASFSSIYDQASIAPTSSQSMLSTELGLGDQDLLLATAATVTTSFEFINVSFAPPTDDPSIIIYARPEEMKNPAESNKFFYQIVVTHIITFILGILGNSLAVAVMIGDYCKGKSATNLFLVSLSMADLLLLIVCVPLEVMHYFLLFGYEDGDGYLCKTAKYAEFLSAIASVLNLCAVSLERFIVIVFPMRSRSLCTMSNCQKAVLVVWIAAIFLSMPAIARKHGYSMTYANNVTSTTVYYCNEYDTTLPYAIYKFSILFFVPGVLMVVCYAYVIRELWRSTKNINFLTNAESVGRSTSTRGGRQSICCQGSRLMVIDNLNNRDRTVLTCGRGRGNNEECFRDKRGRRSPYDVIVSGDSGTSRSGGTVHGQRSLVKNVQQNKGEDARIARKQVIKMLILVIILFLVSWGPKLILTIILKLCILFGVKIFTPNLYSIRVIFNLLPFIHSCINPVIYSFMSKNFQRSLQRQWNRCCSCCGCQKCKCETKSDAIPLRSTTRVKNYRHGNSTYSSHYCSLSEAPNTRQTELEGISTM